MKEGGGDGGRENSFGVEGLEGPGTAVHLEVSGVARVTKDQGGVGRIGYPRGRTSHSGANGSKRRGKVMG